MEAELAATLALLIATRSAFVAVNSLAAAARRVGHSLASLCELPPLRRAEHAATHGGVVADALARLSVADLEDARTSLRDIHKRGMWAEAQGSASYPPCLNEFLATAAPPLLFGQGERQLIDRQMAAVVGTRAPSAQGVHVARTCAEWMAARQIAVVSGGARGADSTAHEQAIAAGGYTLVVLPQGLFTYAMPHTMAHGMAAGQVTVLSAFPPKAEWATHAAIMRNAIIAAFARFVCVIEPHKEGGSIRTARCALDRGKQVFIAPAPHDSAAYERLLREGAQPLLASDASIDTVALATAWDRGLAASPRPSQCLLI